jgi:pimeloyl-ACP methyl ester carboxylesterase
VENAVDNSALVRWSTPIPAVVALFAGGALLLVLAALYPLDAAGRVLIGLAGVLLLSVAAFALRQRPRLAIAPGPVLVATRLTATRRYAPSALTKARIVEYPRLGRRVPHLEIDAVDADGSERLLVFGRWDLGADPRDVLDALSVHGLAPRG